MLHYLVTNMYMFMIQQIFPTLLGDSFVRASSPSWMDRTTSHLERIAGETTTPANPAMQGAADQWGPIAVP